MKNFTFLFFLLLSSFGYAQLSLPIDFESTTISYDFVDFDGGTATVIANLQSSGINTSATVAQIVRDGGQPWSGSKLTLANPLDFSTNNTFSMKVFSPAAGIPILFKLEGSGTAAPEVITNTTVANAWETLTWDYTGQPSGTFTDLVFIFDLGTVGDGTASSTFLFDDVEFFDISGGLDQIDLPVTFEDAATVYYDLIDFEGAGPSAIVVDPTDPSNMVGEVLKSNTAGSSAGTTMGGSGFATTIPFSMGNTTMSVRVWSPDAGIQVRLKVEKADDPTISVETEASTTAAGTWETLVFDFNNQATGTAEINFANTYNQASIFFNFGTDGATAGDKTYYWDDVMFGGSVGVDILNAAAFNIIVSPNPANTYFNIEFPEALNESVQLSLFDVSGKLLKQENIQNRLTQISTVNLNSGTYFLRIDTVNGSYYQKVMITK
jgi:hypothetical protein